MIKATDARFLQVGGLGMGGQGLWWIWERWALRRRGRVGGGVGGSGLRLDIELMEEWDLSIYMLLSRGGRWKVPS